MSCLFKIYKQGNKKINKCFRTFKLYFTKMDHRFSVLMITRQFGCKNDL